MWNLFSQFGIRVKALQSFKSILIVFPNTSSQKYKLYNTFLFKFTAHILYFLPKPPEIHKSYGQASDYNSFPRSLWARNVTLMLLHHRGSVVM